MEQPETIVSENRQNEFLKHARQAQIVVVLALIVAALALAVALFSAMRNTPRAEQEPQQATVTEWIPQQPVTHPVFATTAEYAEFDRLYLMLRTAYMRGRDQCANAEENTPEDFQCLWVPNRR